MPGKTFGQQSLAVTERLQAAYRDPSLLPGVVDLVIDEVRLRTRGTAQSGSDLAAFIAGAIYTSRAHWSLTSQEIDQARTQYGTAADILRSSMQGLMLVDPTTALASTVRLLMTPTGGGGNLLSAVVGFVKGGFDISVAFDAHLDCVNALLGRVATHAHMIGRSSSLSGVIRDHYQKLCERNWRMLNNAHPEPSTDAVVGGGCLAVFSALVAAVCFFFSWIKAGIIFAIPAVVGAAMSLNSLWVRARWNRRLQAEHRAYQQWLDDILRTVE